MADYDYEKIFRDIEEKDNAERATSAITPEGGIPTVNFDGTPATAKAVIASPEPQKNLNEWDRLNYVEKAWNSFWGGIHNLQKSSAVDEITEKKKEADEGLSALFGSDDMDLDDASMEKFRMAYADKTVGGEYKKQKERELEEAIGDYIDLSKKDKDYYAPTVVSAASKATEGKGFWESIPAWFAEVSKDPFDYALYIAGSSAGAIAPFLATSMAGGFALNAMKLNSVARAVQAATMGAGSYNVEFGSYIENYLAEKGYDLSNIESIKSALDKEDVNAIREKAFRRAAVVGAFDAISAWIAPIRLNPSNSLRLLSRATTETVQDVAVPASRLHRVGKGLENMTLQTTLQGVMGGAGEAFGQLVNGEKINWGEVFAEAIGEFTTAPVEVVGLAYSANANFNRETTIARNAQEINKNLQDISNVVTAVAAKLPDNGSLQQWCEAVGKDKTLFAFAQDVIDSGAIDKLKEVAPALAQQVIEAAEKKSDVNVPVSDILKLSATDEATARKLLNDVRLTADGMSPNQAEKFLKEGKKGLVDKFNQIIDNAKPDIELRKAIKVETDKIVNELVSTGTTKDVADLQVLPWASWLAVRAKQTGMKPSEIMEKVRLRIQGEQTNEGALNQSVSTALPSAAAVKSAIYPDPLFAHLWADYNEAKKNQIWFATALAKMRSVPGLKGATRGMRNPDNIGEKIVQRIAENLVWLYDKVPEQLRQRSKLWYDGGRKAAETWAQRYGLRARQTAAIVAIFSPQTGWFANMSMAERLLDVYFSARRQKADQAMLDWFDTDQGKGYNKADIEGKSLEELIQANDFRRAAIWVRAYDKAHNSEARHALSPEGGTLDIEMTPTGSGPARTSYMTNKSIETALSVIVDGSVDNIFKQIGSDFKVRDFYNNIFNPGNQNAVTIDTHAVGAGLLSVVSSKDSVVEDNFGNPGNAPSGQKGTYPIYFEAYRRAAQKLGILPRELQSITWEAIRALFDSSEKTKLRPQVEAIWKKADKGEITAEQAREEIFDLAGGFSKTAWEDTNFNNEITQTYDRSHVKLYDDIVQPEPEPVISLEAAPDPNDATAVAQWSKLTDSEKLAITQEVVPWVLNRVALETKTHIDEPSLQRGGYEGTPNYSMATTIEGGSDYVRVARLLATYLRQDSVMAISATPGAGMFPGKLIRIKLPEGYSTEQIDELYNALDGIRDADGNRLIEGHSSVNGIMTIAVDASKLEEIKAGLNEVTGLKWKVDDSFIGFLKPYQTKEDNHARNDTGGSSGIRQEVSAQYNDNLRRETAEMVARKIRERLEARTGSAQVRSSQDRPLTQPRPLFQRGYIGRSESVRASEARQEGQKPLSKWTKKAIIEAMKANGAPEELLRKAEAQPLWVLQQSVLSKTSWHHTGPNYQKTDFYGINDDYSDEKLGVSWVSERIDEAAKAYSADYTEEAKKFAEFALSDFLAFDYYKEHQLGIFKKDRDFKRYTAYQKALESVEEEAHKRAEEFHKRRDTQSSRPLTQRDVARALEQLGYHGSPYHFDRFTLSHIGSGEGAQAHGWGLYFALSRAVAEGYRKRLELNAIQEREITYKGRPFSEFREALDRELHELAEAKLTVGEQYEQQYLLEQKIRAVSAFVDAGENGVYNSYACGDITQDTYEWFTKEILPDIETEGPGKVYTVEIPDDDVLLREEFSLSSQPKKVQDALRKIFEENTTFAQKAKLYREQWYKEAMEQMANYSYEFYIPTNVYSAIAKLAKEEGPQIFTDEKKVLEKISGEIDKAAKERYLTDEETKESYDEMATEDKKGIDIAREEIIEEGGLNSDGLFWTILHVARWNYPYLLNGGYGPKFEITDSLSGYQLYKWIAKFAGGEKEASILLSKYGIKGIRYTGLQDGECAVVWDEQSIKILNALEQSMQSGPRGTYMPQNTSDTNSMSGVMTLMQTRDKSTFLRESAHVWLDADTMLAKNIAEKVKSGQEITDGEKAFLKNLGGFFRWGQSEGVIDLGVTDDISTVADAVIRWSQMTTNDQRMMHELFAEGFESYLLEGTAPNPEMRTVFGRFKKWLMDIYARATKQPRPISREVRKLYDLMFATQQQAQDTETRLGLQAMFKAADAKKLGMTDAEVQAYEELQEQATLETEGLVAKMVRGTMRIFGKARQDEIARIEKDKEAIAKKEAELLEEPRYRAVAMLNARQTVLDIRQMQGYDTDTIDALDAKGWISHDGGVSPDVLASMAGTTDAVGLIGDILDIDTVGDAHDEALRILAFEERKEFGDEGVFDELRANLAAYNDTRSRLLTAEYNAIARMLGNQQILRSAAREYAIEQIGNTKMSDLHPYTFVQAEQRCAREAEEALRKGDYAACLETKRGQVLNHELARAALEAQERMDKGIRAVRRAMKSKTIHPQYKQLIAALVNAHAISNMTKAEREEFAKVEGMPPEKVTEFLAKLEENGTPVDGVAEILQTHEHVQDMTAYTAEDFFGVVKQVATLGRNVLNQSLTEIAESVKEVVALGKEKLNEAADVQGRKVLKHQRSPMTRKERAFDSVAKFLLSNVKIQSWCRIFDRNKDGGFFWNLFIRSANEHANFEAEQRARCSQVLREKLLPAFKKSQDEDPIAIPGFDRPFTHGMRLAVALNLGNESNKQRLITNDPRFTTEALQAIMDSLTEADWRAVEAVWQLFESFKTAIGEKELRVYGVEPEWIKYEPFKVKTKEDKTITVSGGYYPVKYDPVASNKVDKRTDAEATEQDLRGAYQSATTRRSFTQSRVTGDVTDMPLRLDLTALYEGLNDVIHDLAWHEWLIDTKRVLDGAGGPDSGLRAAIKERYGYNVAKEFEEWRKDIALGGRSEGSSEALSFCLRNVGMATMGYSLTSAAVQLTGAGYVIPRTGVKAFTVALGKYLTSPLKTRRFVNSQSQAMLLRAQTQFKELAQIRNRLDQGKGFRAWMVDHAYSMMTFMQGIVDSVCWQAAYEKFSRQGYEGKELTALCDQTVIDTQSSGNISDLSRIERDKRGLARMMTMFYSWMNAALNMVVTTGMSEENKAKKIASLFWMCAVMPLIEQTFRDSLAAKGDDDDDDDDELAWMREDLGTIVEFNLGLLPVTREFSTAAESLVKGEPVFDYRGPAGLRLLSNVTGGIKTLANPDERKITRAITDLGGSLLGLPSVQINRTVKGVRAINSGQAEGFDAIKAPLFGFKGKIDD